jgi:Spy/CpxP family protein refolding chaperone
LKRLAALLFALCFAAPVVRAQQEREGDERRRPAPDKLFKMVDGYFLANLKERLDLTDEQYARVVPHVQRLQGNRRELTRRRLRAMHEMRKALLSGTATEAAVEELLREVKAVEADEDATLRRDREAVDAALTPVQQAKYRLLEIEVERRVRHALAGSHGRGGPGRARRGPGREPPPEN